MGGKKKGKTEQNFIIHIQTVTKGPESESY